MIPQVILAPMQGVLDPFVRKLLTAVNDYDLCISEFVRVVDQKLPRKTFYRLCPELHNQGLTASGTPVRVQLLGQYPEWLAENAMLAIELGSHGVDLGKWQPRWSCIIKNARIDLSSDQSHSSSCATRANRFGKSTFRLG